VQARLDGIRLLQWEALGGGERKPVAEEERRKAWVEAAERLRDAQRAGHLQQDLDAEYLVLALMALTIFPHAFPQVVQMVTGLRPSDPEFQQGQARFLRRLGTSLRPPSAATKSPQRRSTDEHSTGRAARAVHRELHDRRRIARALSPGTLGHAGREPRGRLGRAVGHPVARADRP
jgi:hypothetical protein